MSYSNYVLISELIKKKQSTIYLKELRNEIVALIGLGTIGFEVSLHLRRCIELLLKHIFYKDHPIEFQILTENIKFGTVKGDYKTVTELFDYLKKHPNLRVAKELNDQINILHECYGKLCEIVHIRKIDTPLRLEKNTIPKFNDDEITIIKENYRKIMRSILILTIIYHIKHVSKFNGFIKETILFSLNPTLSRDVRSTLSI